MSGLSGIITSGLNDAVLRLATAAKNIVNASSTSKLPAANETYTGYQPQDVISLSNTDAGGNALGVTSITTPRQPAYYAAPDANSPDANSDGLVAVPNVDLNVELIASKEASISYAATAKLLKSEQEMDKALLDAIR